MTNTKDIIVKLKEVREEKGLSFGDILNLMEANGDYLSKSTLSRVFAEGSEDNSFKYEETIRPIAKALLDIETIEETDNMDVQAMKSLLKYKIQLIEDQEKQIAALKAEINSEKIKYLEKMETEREKFQKSIDFCRDQIDLKDKRIDQLLDTTTKLLNQLLTCPCRKEYTDNGNR